MTIPNGYYRVKEAAAMTGNSPNTLREWIKKGRLPAIRDRVYYVRLEDVKKCRQRDRVSTRVPEMPPEELMTVRRAAQATGANIRTIQHWAKTGQIRAQKYGGMWYVDPADIT